MRATNQKNIAFTTDVSTSLKAAHVIIIAVNTPAKEIESVISQDGRLIKGCPTNMTAFFSVVRAISDSIVA